MREMARQGKERKEELNLANDPMWRVAMLVSNQSDFNARDLYEKMLLDEIKPDEFWQGIKANVKSPKLLKIIESAEQEAK